MTGTRVTHVVEALGRGGLERVVALLAAHASTRLSVEVVALCGGGPLAEEMAAAGIPVRILGLRDYYPGSVLRAARALRAARPDVVHTHGHFAGVAGRLAARLLGVRATVHHLHTCDPTLKPRHRRLERLLARRCAAVLCCSEAVACHAAEKLGVPRPLLQVVPNGIAPPPPGATRDAAQRFLDEVRGAVVVHGPLIGCVGSLVRHKGQDVLLDALPLLPEAYARSTVCLVGEGPELAALEARAARTAPGRVIFCGARADVRRLLPAFDVLAVPSRGREGLGLVVLEGMDASLPVVASRVGGLPEVVEDGRTGRLVPEGDAAALARAIASVLGRPDRGAAWGAAGKDRVERDFRAARMAARIESLYEVALGPVRRAA
jgi:glycosyltransferase involved in cell wall biosynthesis